VNAERAAEASWTSSSLDGTALELRGVRRTFEAENAPVRALRGVDMTVTAGEFVALTGPSGCGKSTLLNLVAGLDVPDDGTIAVAGELVTGRGEDDLARLRRRHIGIVFQFFNLLEGMTVLENVALPALIAGRKRRMAETRARDLLDLLGIGVSTGEAAAALLGSEERLEYTLVGDTVNLSQRLQQLGSAGETVISGATRRALSLPGEMVALPAQLVKGRDTPIIAYKIRVAAPRQWHPRPPTAARPIRS